MSNLLYHYKAKVIRVVDGDTVRLNIDLGFTVSWESNCRLHGINAPELNSLNDTEREVAQHAKQFLMDQLKAGDLVYIKSEKLDKYGRPLVKLYYGDAQVLVNDELLSNGLALPM